MYIDNSELDFELYGDFYQTERMLAIKFYEGLKYIFFCKCFTKRTR